MRSHWISRMLLSQAASQATAPEISDVKLKQFKKSCTSIGVIIDAAI
jgi:hypothetical protein